MSSLALFEEPGPRLFTTAPGAPFALSVAKGLAARAAAASGGDPLALADVVLIASTRRAVRAFRSAFAAAGGGVAIAPRMTALAELDSDLLEPADAVPGPALPPAINPLRRELLLARLVRAALLRDPALGAPAVAPKLAADLAALLDDCWAAGVPLTRLGALTPERHAAHWAKSWTFLEIIASNWPAILAGQPGAPIDPADRRRRQLERLTALWAETPPKGPVIVAGSPTDPAAAELIAAVASLPQGAAVLPGYDRGLDRPAAQSLIDGRAPEHPQAELARLVAALGLDPCDGGVRPWSAETGLGPRQRLLAQAMRPAPATDHWRAAADALARDAAEATAGLTLLEAAGPRDEAAAIALALREALETPDRTAALITPDRTLARRVSAELARWGVKPDDSSGRPLALTPPGVFFQSVLEAALGDCAPAALLALLKHPLAGAGFPRGAHLRRARRLEREVLRGAPPMQGAADLARRIAELAEEASRSAEEDAAEAPIEDGQDAAPRPETPNPDAHGLGPALPEDGPRLAEWFGAVADRLAPLTAILAQEEADLGAILAAHEQAAIRLSEQLKAEDAPPEPQLFDKIAGQELQRFLETLRAEADAMGPIAPKDYPALLGHLIGRQAVREPFGRHRRILILGALEARMQSADLVILAGLNEGVWPKPPEPDPWISRDMRRALGLPPLEAKIGLSAHDFTLAATAPQAILSRTRKTDGAPTRPSRWLLRLTNLLNGVARPELEAMRRRGAALLARLDQLEAGEPDAPRLRAAPRPRPKPPLEARARRFSVTEIETLIRDPYAIYAKKTLRLRALEPIEAAPDQRDRGRLLHSVVEALVRETRAQDPFEPQAAAALFDRIAEERLAPFAPWPTLHAFWGARLGQVRDWFLEGEASRRALGRPVALETVGALRFETALGDCWLTAKADRIDKTADPARGAGYAIYDYKAGKPPTPQQVAAFAKQLPLEAAILAADGFDGAPPGQTTLLGYLSLSGGETGGAELILPDDPAALAASALEGLKRLLGGYADPKLGYAARLRPEHLTFEGDYDHLARFGEWRDGRAEGAV